MVDDDGHDDAGGLPRRKPKGEVVGFLTQGVV